MSNDEWDRVNREVREWKDRAETSEHQIAVLESREDSVMRLARNVETIERQNAAMREVLIHVQKLVALEDCPCTSCERNRLMVANAIASDAGKSYVPVEDVKPLIEVFDALYISNSHMKHCACVACQGYNLSRKYIIKHPEAAQ